MSTRAETQHPLAPGWPEFLVPPLASTRTTAAVVVVAAVAATFDLAIQSGLAGVAGTLCVVVASAGLLAAGRLRNRQAIVLVALAPLFGSFLSVRATPWLVPLNVLAACALVTLGASLSSGGSVWDLSGPRIVARAMQAVAQAVLGPSYVIGSEAGGASRARSIVRGLALAVPVVLVLGLLLASADAVFASLVRFDTADLVGHVVLLVFGGVAMAGLIRLASVERAEVPATTGPRWSSTEWTIVLGSLDVLLGAFAVARLIALSEGGRRVIGSAGLTYAEYARSGFFELLAASVIVAGVLLVMRAGVPQEGPQRRSFVVLGLATVALTLVVVVSAFHRLLLYEAAFGLTMLRVYVQAAIVFVAVFMVLLGVSIAGRWRRQWLWGAAGTFGLAMLLALNVMNPEAYVTRHNLEHTRAATFDPGYLVRLSDDAVPALAADGSAAARERVCATTKRRDFVGWAAYNLSEDRADDIRDRLCREGG